MLARATLTMLLAGLCAAAARADDPAPSALQARLDALQHITVTEARPPAAEVAPPSAEVNAVLRAAAEDETSAGDQSTVEADSGPGPATR